MGEKPNQPFQLSFNSSLKVDFQGARVTSYGALLLVRELGGRLRFSELTEQHFADSRRGRNTHLALPGLLRQSAYSHLAGCEDVNGSECLSQDPTLRLIGSEKIWGRGASLTSRLQSFETELLTQEENVADLPAINRELISWAQAFDSSQRVVASDEADVRSDSAAECGAAGASRVAKAVAAEESVKKEAKDREVFEKWLGEEAVQVFRARRNGRIGVFGGRWGRLG